MNRFWRVLILGIFICCCVALPVSGESGSGILGNLSNLSLEVPPTGTAVAGTDESMTQYLSWLNQCAANLMEYSNKVLEIFGIDKLDWGNNIQDSPSQVTAIGTMSSAPAGTVPTLTIPESTRVKTIGKITGGSGRTIQNISVPTGYWELTYTVDPQVRGGQDSHSSTGSNSAVFPIFTVTITDLSTGKTFDTVDCSGELDPMLWQRSDPRPWYKRYYSGNREFEFEVTARRVNAYIVEVRIPRE